MTIQKIREAHEKRPFQPFAIHTADGEVVRVKHPEFLMVTPPGRTIYVATGRGEEVQTIDLLLVTKLTSGAINGKRKHNGRHRSH
jgi:hypothetical protein